ncbi:MAG: hypothetical protein C0404_03545 [Verrucomicrobia bacterium]|nr:hypothetical protein [Verrucomicrobiota bacterium]
MMKPQYMATGLLVSGLCIGAALACPQGYESPEALVKRARLILELDPVSVSDVQPPPKDKKIGMSFDEPRERKNAQASVKVVRVVKGKSNINSFTLIGGPYSTCAPYPSYVSFEKGRRIYLILDRDIPENTKTVVVTWRCRVLPADRKELAALLDNARNAWTKSLDLHRKSAPAAFKEAQELLAASNSASSAAKLKLRSYPVLACLRALLMNLADVPPAVPGPEPDTSQAAPITDADDFSSERINVKGFYYTDQQNSFPLPETLQSALATRGKAEPQAVRDFNKTLFEAFLRDDLLLADSQIHLFLSADELTNSMNRIAFSPFKCDIQVDGKRSHRDLISLSYLIALADDEPDSLVWKTGGLPEDIDLNVDMFAGYIEKNMTRDYTIWPRLSLLLELPHPKIAPVIRNSLKQEENFYRLNKYFRFFLRLADHERAQSVLEKFRITAFDGSIQKLPPEERKAGKESILTIIRGFQDTMIKKNVDDPKLTATLLELKKQAEAI